MEPITPTNDSISNKRTSHCKSTKMSEFFRKMFLNALKTHSKEKFVRNHYKDTLSKEEILKNELSKPIISKPQTLLYFTDDDNNDNNNKEQQDQYNAQAEDYPKQNEERSIINIMMTLYQLEDFERYLKFNGINDETIRLAAGFMKVESYKKGSYIFRQSDAANKFYGIIKGIISIRAVPGSKLIRNESRDTLEEERTRMNPGMCFGEWALIYKIVRTASAYCLEDVDVFVLEREVFDKTLSKAIVKAEMEKKKFVTQKIPLLANCGRISDILSAINPLFFDKNQLIYTEFDPAESLYVIYQGECCLTTTHGNGNVFKSRVELEENKDSLVPIYNFDKGAILGLETVHQKGNCYSYTLMASMNYTVVYQLKYSRLNFLSADIYNFIAPLQRIQESLIQRAINNFERKRISMTRIENPDAIYSMLEDAEKMKNKYKNGIEDNLGNNNKKYILMVQNESKGIGMRMMVNRNKGQKGTVNSIKGKGSANGNGNSHTGSNTSPNHSYMKISHDFIDVPKIGLKQRRSLVNNPIHLTKESNLTFSNMAIKNEIHGYGHDNGHGHRPKAHPLIKPHHKTSSIKGDKGKAMLSKEDEMSLVIRPKRRSMVESLYFHTIQNLQMVNRNCKRLSYYDSGNYNLPLLSCGNSSNPIRISKINKK